MKKLLEMRLAISLFFLSVISVLSVSQAFAITVYPETGALDKDSNNALRVSNDSGSPYFVVGQQNVGLLITSPAANTVNGSKFYSWNVTSTDQVKATGGTLYSVHAHNTTAAVAFLQIFNNPKASVTLGTTSPDMVIGVQANDQTNWSSPVGINMGSGLTVASTTTRFGSTTAVQDVDISYQ